MLLGLSSHQPRQLGAFVQGQHVSHLGPRDAVIDQAVDLGRNLPQRVYRCAVFVPLPLLLGMSWLTPQAQHRDGDKGDAGNGSSVGDKMA
jgi:hypothetical protein